MYIDAIGLKTKGEDFPVFSAQNKTWKRKNIKRGFVYFSFFSVETSLQKTGLFCSLLLLKLS
jgi:hypothetical protein